MIGQTKRQSLIEAWINVLVGFGVNFVANLLILPLFGLKISLLSNFYLGLCFTVVSVGRSYFIRRFFNLIHTRQRHETKTA